ncbi:MAG: GNAT family N-acetyltransferase [Pseudomonadota bacterium]
MAELSEPAAPPARGAAEGFDWRLNAPLDLAPLASMLADDQDLRAANPFAARPFDAEEWRGFLAMPACESVLVERNRRCIAHFALKPRPPDCHIAYVVMAAEARGRGLGRALVALIEAVARLRHDPRALTLQVNDWNPRARRLYDACGFVAVGEDGDATLMRKTLA